MTTWKMFLALLAGSLVFGSIGRQAALADDKAKEEKPVEAGGLVVIDQNDKEHRLAKGKWRFSSGTQRLAWVAGPAAVKPAKEPDTKKDREANPNKAARPQAPSGPEVLVFRDEKSTNLRDGILTYILLDRIRAIDYDQEKKTVTVRVVKAGDKGEDEETLEGSTRYVGENMLTIEAETDLGELGVARLKFQTRGPKGIKSIRFPPPQAPPAAKGRPAEVTAADKDKNVHKVTDLKPLYRMSSDGSERLLSKLCFKKTVKIDLDKIQKLSFAAGGEKGDGLEYEVTLKDGKELTLTLLERTDLLGDKEAILRGFVGRVPAGYKIFPLKPSPNNTFTAIQFEEAKKEEKKEEPKKEEAKKEVKE